MAIRSLLRNYARGGATFHSHSIEIVRDLLDGEDELEKLSPFLRDRLFRQTSLDWRAFAFGPKDWDLCGRLLTTRNVVIERRMLRIATYYIAANIESVLRMYGINRTISAAILKRDTELIPSQDLPQGIDRQSLFNFRVQCAVWRESSDAMRDRLQELFLRNGWCNSRLLYPMVFYFLNTTSTAALDNLLGYIVTGKEHNAEKVALKLILSDEAARDSSLAFKVYVGMMGHAYDACEFILDHIELKLLEGVELPPYLLDTLSVLADLLPDTRASRLRCLHAGELRFVAPDAEGATVVDLHRVFPLSADEISMYGRFCSLGPFIDEAISQVDRPYGILSNMRRLDYPVPEQFGAIIRYRATWFFTEGGRFLSALLRSIYMIDRTSRDLEARDAVRLAVFFGHFSPFIASAPSAMFALRMLRNAGIVGPELYKLVERDTSEAMAAASPAEDRLWINQLQWRLRELEEQGRIQSWLHTIRTQTRLRPLFLTGINWAWVEEIIEQERLKPFMSFDGAYLFLLMELETVGDAQRLRLALEPLLQNRDFANVVETIIDEFGGAAPTLIRRYLTTQTLVETGLAPNLVAALDQRVRALEACIKKFGFSPLLTEEVYEGESRTLTSELLLTNVNAGKFEIPWDTFRKDAVEEQQDLYNAFLSLRPRADDSALTAFVETPVTFNNGRSITYRYRLVNAPLFSLLVQIISDFATHPGFGLEVILSGRFRHSKVLQELWSAMASVNSAMIPSVQGSVQATLASEYRPALEQVVEGWCAKYLHTRRDEKPFAAFDIVPTQKEIDELILEAQEHTELIPVIDTVIDWLKRKLREQVSAAANHFVDDMTSILTSSFAHLRDQQLASGHFRHEDVRKVSYAIVDAVVRRIAELKGWFDGIDTISAGPVSLAQLSMATETLFDNMLPSQSLRAEADLEASNVQFTAGEVKIAFDLLREIFFNALRYGDGPEVTLTLSSCGSADALCYRFANDLPPPPIAPETVRIEGSRYEHRNDAVLREGNSGLHKIAASAATLIGRDTSIERVVSEGRYALIVPLRSTCAA